MPQDLPSVKIYSFVQYLLMYHKAFPIEFELGFAILPYSIIITNIEIRDCHEVQLTVEGEEDLLCLTRLSADWVEFFFFKIFFKKRRAS